MAGVFRDGIDENFADVVVRHEGRDLRGIYRGTRKDGRHLVHVRLGGMKTRKYFHPDRVTFKNNVDLYPTGT